MLFVPREPFAAALPGLAPPRAVPSDLVVAVASRVLPADIVQKVVLLAIFVLACSGAAALLDREPLLARLAAGVFYAWNPYVGERLIIGQWALLLGYAGLPWVLRAVLAPDLASRRGARRLALALLPATVGGFAAMAVTALLAVPAAAAGPERPPGGRRAGRPGRRQPARGSSRPCCTRSTSTRPASPRSRPGPTRRSAASAACSCWAAPGTPRPSPRPTAGRGRRCGWPWSSSPLAAYLLFAARQRRWPGLGVAAVAGLVIAALGVTAAGRDLLRSLIGAWPGLAVLRDAQQFVAPLALAEAVGFGLAVAAALKLGRPEPRPARTGRTGIPRPVRPECTRTRAPGPRKRGRDRTRRPRSARPVRADAAGTMLAVLALLAPVLLLPGLAWGAAGRLRPAWYPAAWLAAARSLDASAARGSVLLLPWATYRTPPWNHGEVVLDPWTRLLSRPVIWNDGTQVGDVALAPDDPRARSLTSAIDGGGPLTAALRAAGVRFVLDDADGPGPHLAARLPGSVVIINLPGLTVYQLPA